MLKKKRKAPSRFLPALPTSNIAGWWENRRTDPARTLTGGEHKGWYSGAGNPHPRHGSSNGASSSSKCGKTNGGVKTSVKRSDMPVVRHLEKADAELVRAHAMDPDTLRSLENDMYAATSRGPRDAQCQTWGKFHCWCFGKDVPVLPLTEEKIKAISSLFQVGGTSHTETTCLVSKKNISRQDINGRIS